LKDEEKNSQFFRKSAEVLEQRVVEFQEELTSVKNDAFQISQEAIALEEISIIFFLHTNIIK
jgi:hypothetical protein